MSEVNEVQLLGTFHIRHGDKPIYIGIAAARLVVFLCLHQSATRQQIAGTLSPEVDEKRAQSNLRTMLWRVQQIDKTLLVSDRSALSLGAVQVDSTVVERWTATVIASAATGEMPPAVPPNAGRTLLPGWDEPWLEPHRERLRLLQLQAFESMGNRYLSMARPAEALVHAITVVQAAPLRESANQLMIDIHLRQGNIQEAVRHFLRYRTLLRTELGVEPGIAMTSLLSPYLPRTAAPTPV